MLQMRFDPEGKKKRKKRPKDVLGYLFMCGMRGERVLNLHLKAKAPTSCIDFNVAS